MNSRLIIKMIVPIALTAGLLLGLFTPAIATAQWSFAGYRQSLTNIATQSQIPYANPNVPTGQSLEWALAANGSGSVFVQSGWIKKSGWTGPKHFVEYSCPTVCEFDYGAVSSGTTHTYEVQETPAPNARWCLYVDGVSEQCISTTTLGMGNASQSQYSGETSDTNADLGGTASNHLHMYNLLYENTSNSWFQASTGTLTSITTGGTPYYASDGYTSPYTWIENWTAR